MRRKKQNTQSNFIDPPLVFRKTEQPTNENAVT